MGVTLTANNSKLSEDAISREDALMALTGECTELTDELIHQFTIRRIKNLPPVNPKPKTAHWIKVQGRPHHARCSKCNKVTAYAWGMDYCPRCGHRMEVRYE